MSPVGPSATGAGGSGRTSSPPSSETGSADMTGVYNRWNGDAPPRYRTPVDTLSGPGESPERTEPHASRGPRAG